MDLLLESNGWHGGDGSQITGPKEGASGDNPDWPQTTYVRYLAEKGSKAMRQ